MINPFTSRNMIKDIKSFFGRKGEIEEIYTNLIDLQSTSILGERRSGKSSLLWHIAQPEIYKQFPSYNRKPLLIVFFDLQKVASFTTKTFFKLLSENLLSRLPEKYSLNKDSFDTYQEYFYELVDNSYDDFRIVICLDEFETVVSNSQFDNAFLLYLRHFANLGKLAYITSSREPLESICKNTNHLQGSDFWNIFASPALNLNLFKKDEAVEMLTTLSTRGKIQLEPIEFEFLFELAGYHPMFLQIAAFYLFEVKKQKIDSNESGELTSLNRNNIAESFSIGVAPHYEHIWDRLSTTEKEVVVNCKSINSEGQFKENIRSLKKKGILIEKEGVHSFSQNFASFAEERLSQKRNILVTVPEKIKGENLKIIGDKNITDDEKFVTFQQMEDELSEQGKLDIWLGRGSEVLVNFSGPYSIAKFCTNKAKLDINSIKRFELRVNAMPQVADWRLEKQEIGQDVVDLFSTAPEVSEIYTGARAVLNDEERLLITFKCSQELLAFPFEFINTFSTVDEGIKHLVLTHPIRKTVVGVRSKKTPLSRRFYSDPNARILFVNSNVSGEFILEKNKYYLPDIPGTFAEIQTLEEMVKKYKDDGVIKCAIDVKHDVTLDEISTLIRYGKYDLIHFSGHGMYSDSPESSCLFFWKKPGGKSVNNSIQMLTASQLNELVSKTRTKFIYLSCCHGAMIGSSDQLLVNDFLGITHSLLMGGIPSILSMRWALDDEMAIHLAKSFYKELFSGVGIEISLLRARRQVQAAKPYDYNWLSPILVMQGNY